MILFLSDVAGSEILLILVFILIFFGSKSIPGIAQTMGRTIRQIKDASDDLQQEIKKSGMDIKKDLNLNRIIEETEQEITHPLQTYANELEASVKFEPKKISLPTENFLDENPTEKSENQLDEKSSN